MCHHQSLRTNPAIFGPIRKHAWRHDKNHEHQTWMNQRTYRNHSNTVRQATSVLDWRNEERAADSIR